MSEHFNVTLRTYGWEARCQTCQRESGDRTQTSLCDWMEAHECPAETAANLLPSPPPGWLHVNRGRGWFYVPITKVNSAHVGPLALGETNPVMIEAQPPRPAHPNGDFHVWVSLDLNRLSGEWASAFLDPPYRTEEEAELALLELLARMPPL